MFGVCPPCPPAVRLTECFGAHSLATGAALNCFPFQTLKTERSDLAFPANSLTLNEGGEKKMTWEENMPPIAGKMNQTDEQSAVLFGVCQRSD